MRTKPNANVRKILRMGKYRYGNTLDVKTLAQLNRRIRNMDVHGERYTYVNDTPLPDTSWTQL